MSIDFISESAFSSSSRRSALVSMAMVSIAAGSNVQSFISSVGISTLYSSQFASLDAALAAWAIQGGELVIDADYNIASPPAGAIAIDVQLTANKEYVLSSRTKRKFTYTGASIATMIRILGANNAPVQISGITFDGGNLTNKPLWIDYGTISGMNRADIDVSGTFLNAYGDTKGRGDITGLKITGGFRDVHVHDFRVDSVNRAAGVIDIGFNGCQGFQLFGAGEFSFISAVIERGTIRNVKSDDAVGSASYLEMDGVIIFQAAAAGTRAPILRDMIFEECLGRAIKIYSPGGGPLVERFDITRSTQGVGDFYPGGGSQDIDIQGGWGAVKDGVVRYRGAANATPTTPIAITASYDPLATAPFGPVVIHNVLIDDTTGVRRSCVVDVRDNSPSANTPRQVSLKNIRDTGLAEILFHNGKSGGIAPCRVLIENVECDVSVAATRINDATPFLFVNARRLENRNGADRPVKVTLDNAMYTVDWGDWLGDETVHGFARYTGGWRGMLGFTNGFRGPGGGVEATPVYGKSEVSGRIVPRVVELADGATWTGPPVGLYADKGGDYVFALRLSDSYKIGYARFQTAANSTAFKALDAIVGAVIEKTDIGADTATRGKLIVWKDGATQRQKVSNHTGRILSFQPVFNG